MVKKTLILIAIIMLSIIPLSYAASDFGYNRLYKDITAININETNNITNIFQNITINATDIYLNNLSDVQVPSPADGESLVWDSGIMKWISETVISRWIVSTANGFLFTIGDTLYYNDTLLNDTIVAVAGSAEDNNFHIYINGSSYNNIHHNITAGDADNVEFTIIPGNKFIFADKFT